MKLTDIKDSITVDMNDVKSAEKVSLGAIGKYTLIRIIGAVIFLISFLIIVAILHHFGVSINFR